MLSGPLGVVVIGMGLAGRARVRDIGRAAQFSEDYKMLEGVELIGYVSK